jgi:hypothetical protein
MLTFVIPALLPVIAALYKGRRTQKKFFVYSWGLDISSFANCDYQTLSTELKKFTHTHTYNNITTMNQQQACSIANAAQSVNAVDLVCSLCGHAGAELKMNSCSCAFHAVRADFNISILYIAF